MSERKMYYVYNRYDQNLGLRKIHFGGMEPPYVMLKGERSYVEAYRKKGKLAVKILRM